MTITLWWHIERGLSFAVCIVACFLDIVLGRTTRSLQPLMIKICGQPPGSIRAQKRAHTYLGRQKSETKDGKGIVNPFLQITKLFGLICQVSSGLTLLKRVHAQPSKAEKWGVHHALTPTKQMK